MTVEFRLRRDDGRWSTDNTVLGPGEPGVSGHYLGIGDGHTGWNDLPKFIDETLIGAPDPGVIEAMIQDYVDANVIPLIPPAIADPDPRLDALEAKVMVDLDAVDQGTYILADGRLGMLDNGAQIFLGNGVNTVTELIGDAFSPNQQRVFPSIQRGYAWAQGAAEAWGNGNNIIARLEALEGGP